MEKREYKARCHCGKVRFSFRAPEITKGARCNCSLCIRRGAVMSDTYFPATDFNPLKTLDEVTGYRWNDFVVDALFCKTCGIMPYFGNKEYGYRVNLGCVEGLDAYALEIRTIDGRSMTVSENPGPHPGDKT